MEFRKGERILGQIKNFDREREKILVSVREGVTGIVDLENNNGINRELLQEGEEIYVTIESEDKDEEGRLSLKLEGLLQEDKLLNQPKSYSVNNSSESMSTMNSEKSNDHGEELTEQLEEWFYKVEKTLKELRQHRSKRLDEEFYIEE